MSHAERSIIIEGLDIVKGFKSKLPRSPNRPEFQPYRYSEIFSEDMQDRITRVW